MPLEFPVFFIFLSSLEIGEMSLMAEAKILRMIETKEIQRLGSRRTSRIRFPDDRRHQPGCRVAGELIAVFRRDLYFRSNVARIHVPPPRERKTDIPLGEGHSLAHKAVFADLPYEMRPAVDPDRNKKPGDPEYLIARSGPPQNVANFPTALPHFEHAASAICG
jgi:hypothetical protein